MLSESDRRIRQSQRSVTHLCSRACVTSGLSYRAREAEHGVTEPCLLVSQVTELDPRNADGQCAVT